MSKRKPNFCDREIEHLINCVETHKSAIVRKFSGPGKSAVTKTEVWKTIQAELQSTTTINRTTDDLKKKRNDLKLNAKKEVAQA